jgi:hypothetical protein
MQASGIVVGGGNRVLLWSWQRVQQIGSAMVERVGVSRAEVFQRVGRRSLSFMVAYTSSSGHSLTCSRRSPKISAR